MDSSSISDDHKNITKNFVTCSEIIPEFYRTLADFACRAEPKNSEETLYNYIKRRKLKGKFNRKTVTKLQSTDFHQFDSSFLQELIPILSDGLIKRHQDKDEYQQKLKNKTSVESLLNKIINFRNEKYHVINAITKNSYRDIEQTLLRAIEEAGILFKISPSELDKEKCIIINQFELLEKTVIATKDLIEKTSLVLKSEVFTQLGENFKGLLKIQMPGQNIVLESSAVFQNIPLFTSAGGNKKKLEFQSKYLFQVVKSNFKVICGLPGSGKTTLLRNIVSSVLNLTDHSYPNTEEYDFVVNITCRLDTVDNVGALLKKGFPKILNVIPIDIIISALHRMKVLFTIDGFDERNEISEKLVREVVNMCMNNSNLSCVITTRYHDSKTLSSLLKGAIYEIIFIDVFTEPIQQQKLVEKYALEICRVSAILTNIDNLVCSYIELLDQIKKSFVAPIHLLLFCSLCISKPDLVKKLKCELDLYEAICVHSKSYMKDKLMNANCKNIDAVLNMLIGKIQILSLKLFHDKKYYLSDEIDYEPFKLECLHDTKRFNENEINWDDVLSSFFYTEHSTLSDRHIQYTHSSIQEFTASECITHELLQEGHTRSIVEIIADTVDFSAAKDIQRYGTIIKFILLRLSKSKKLNDYYSTLVNTLRLLKPNFLYCINVIAASNNDEELMKIISTAGMFDVPFIDEIEWEVHDSRFLPGLSYLLEHHKTKPAKVDIVLNEPLHDIQTSLTNTLQRIKTIQYEGRIVLWISDSYEEYRIMDQTAKLLNQLECHFEGVKMCVSSKQAAETLCNLKFMSYITPVILAISISSPKKHPFYHCEEKFHNWPNNFGFRVKCTKIGNSQKKPLPRGVEDCKFTAPDLTITHISNDDADNVYDLVKFLAPVDNKFEHLNLMHCPIELEKVKNIACRLQADDIRTTVVRRYLSPPEVVECPVDIIGTIRCSICSQCHVDDMYPCYRLQVSNWSTEEYEAKMKIVEEKKKKRTRNVKKKNEAESSES